MGGFEGMGHRGAILAGPGSVAAAPGAGPNIGLAGTGKDHAAKAMAAVRAQNLVNGHFRYLREPEVAAALLRRIAPLQAALLAPSSRRTNSVPCTIACSLSMAMYR